MTVISLLGLILACDTGGSSGSATTEPPNKTPKVSDYTITGTNRSGEFFVGDGTTKREVRVTLTDPAVGSPGAVTVKYNGEAIPGGPSATDLYIVTFDVAAAKGWDAIADLSAGFVNITDGGKFTPVIENFTITGFPVTLTYGDPTPTWSITKNVDAIGAVTPKFVKTDLPSAPDSANFPTGVGTYRVEFSVPATATYNAASFIAGAVVIKAADEKIQVIAISFADFDVILQSPKYLTSAKFSAEGNSASPLVVPFSGDEQRIVVKPKDDGKAPNHPYNRPGVITLSYFDVKDATKDPVQLALPKKEVGFYKVNVSIAGSVVANPNTGETVAAFSATEFDLWYNIDKRTPVKGDYNISNMNQPAAGNVFQVITPVKHAKIERKTDVTESGSLNVAKSGIASNGVISITYTGTELGGTSSKTFGPFNETKVIAWNTVVDTYLTNPDATNLAALNAAADNAPPQNAGSYVVTFTVAEPTGGDIDSWKAATDPITADTFKLEPLIPAYPGFVFFWVNTDEQMLQLSTTNDAFIVVPNGQLTFTKSGGLGDVKEWWVDGNKVEPNSGDPNRYTFSSSARGWHTVTVFVDYLGKLYSKTSRVRVWPSDLQG